MSSDEKILFIPYSNTDIKNLARLNETTYAGREISSEDFLQWEYEKNPEGKAIINVAEAGNNIVSQYLVLPKTFSIDNKIIVGSLSVNTLTHPDYRKRGLFIKLAKQVFERCAEEKIHFTIGFPNPALHPVVKKNNLFDTIGFVPMVLYPLHPLKSLIKYFSGNRNKSGDEIYLNLTADDFKNFPDVATFDFNIDKTVYNNFISKFNKQKSNVKHRSFEYLKWRFLDIPLRKYYFIKSGTDAELKALVIMRAKYIFGLRCLILVDMISDEEGLELKKLFKSVINIARQNNIDLIFSAVTSNSPEHNILKRTGFFAIPEFIMPQRLAFITKKHSKECPEDIDDFQKWFLTFGDFDIF